MRDLIRFLPFSNASDMRSGQSISPVERFLRSPQFTTSETVSNRALDMFKFRCDYSMHFQPAKTASLSVFLFPTRLVPRSPSGTSHLSVVV